MAVLFLSGFVAAPAFAFDIKPGEWEVETKMTGLPAGMELPKTKVCITPEQAKKGPVGTDHPPECKVKITENKKDLVSYEVSCKGEGEMKGSVRRISDGEVVTDVTTTVNEGGQKQTVRTTIRQKYLGPTCSK
ncbi:MAG: DUF3617 domain-containing protein [Proteobacteria bacterium]|nr:DUF3617 domain-containing protein [Pseudomonadota bacterium]MCL2306877.1 DUF3617 domain-containing protein [Pseudomonadota bacterium]